MRKALLNILDAVFSISNFERRAGFVLLFFILIWTLYIAWWRYPEPELELTTQQQARIRAWIDDHDVTPSNTPRPGQIDLCHFDPNSDSYDDLVAAGILPRVATNILNYRNAGGIFRIKADLLRLYTVDSGLFKRLDPYVVIRKAQVEEEVKNERKQTRKPVDPMPTIYLNRATAEEFQRVRGIGPVYARRIVRYRELLGGFAGSEQLYEVYGLDSSVVNELLLYGAIESSPKAWVDVNRWPADSLVKHPYIDWDLARRLVRYRQQHGAFKRRRDVYSLQAVDRSKIDRILPYLYLPEE